MYTKKLVYFTVALLVAALLWGCGSSGSGGSAVTPRTGPDVLESEASCFGCHAEGAMYYAHNPANSIWMGTDAAKLVGTVPNLYDIKHSCQDCHGGGAAHSGTRGSLPHPRPTIAVCAECHVNEAVASDYHTFVNTFGDNILACTTCHDPLLAETILDFVASGTRKELSCLDCHNDTLTDAELAQSPIGSEIYARFNDSRHANQNARAAYCSSCHSHEGGVELLSMPRMTANAQLAEAYTADLDVYMLPVASATVEGVTKKNCATCHDPHDAGLRGDGTVFATSANVAGFPTQTEPTAIDGQIRAVYSAEFSLCAACHMVDLTATWDADAGYNSRGMIRYELSDAYTAMKPLEGGGSTYDLSGIFYHDGASGNGRTFVDTHFAGTIHSQLINFDGSSDPVDIVGYNINPGDANACTICHDPHAASKMLSLTVGGSTVDGEYQDVIGNDVVNYAQGMGMTHLNYINDAFSRQQNGCTPCHTGRDFAKMTYGAEIADLGSPRWNTLGCMSCHDLTPANTVSADNAPILAPVRTFPVDYDFAFSSGAIVNDSLDANVAGLISGNDQICFECHKGRTTLAADITVPTTVYGINYLHYSPSFATLVGEESGMYPVYAGKTYNRGTNRGSHNTDSCVDCHNIHTPYGDNANHANFEPAHLQTSLCGSCHYEIDETQNNYWRSFDVLRDRTKVFGDTLFTAIGIEHGTTDAAALKTRLTARTSGSEMGSNLLARTGAIWKNFMYDDKGGWAHNSIFARQLMFDALEELDTVNGNNTYLCQLLANAVTAGIPIVEADKPVGHTNENGTLLFGLGAERITIINNLTCP